MATGRLGDPSKRARMAPVNKNSKTLIVGSDSLVGSAYQHHLEQAGKPAIGTTRRRETADGSRIFLDLADDLSNWACPPDIDVAILCAGITKFAYCQADPVATARVNVVGISKVTTTLVKAGIKVVYLSTAVVFDGLAAQRKADVPVCPTTEYGRQNAQAEKQIQELGDSVTILRLTKTLGPELPLLNQWVTALQKGKAIHPYTDLTMAPIPLSFSVKVLDLVVQTPESGIFQASGDRDITYEEAAQCCAVTLGADSNLVQGIKVNEEDRYTEPVPKYTSLDVSRIKAEFGLEAPNVEQTLSSLFAKIGNRNVAGRVAIGTKGLSNE